MIAADELEDDYQIPMISKLKKPDNVKINVKISKTGAVTAPTEVKQAEVEIKFLSKKERELQKQQLEEEERKKKEEEFKRTKEIRKEYDKFKFKDWKRKQEYEEKRKKYQEELKQRAQSRSRSRSGERYSSKRHEADENEQKQQQESIKQQYLGIRKEQKKLIKPSEKFKNIFNFEWDIAEDTSKDFNILYQRRLNESHMFGRGVKAGYDREKEQQKNGQQPIDNFKRSPTHDPISRQKVTYDMTQGDHWSLKTSQEMSERDWRIFREDNEIIIKGGRVPKPIREWDEHTDIPSFMLDSLINLKYQRPTAIQMQAIPIGLSRKDMIGIAPTGSGKSAAYLIPLIIYLKTLPPMSYERAKDGPYSLILLPSRELAPQVEREFISLCQQMKLKAFVCVGGRQQEEQMFQLQQGCELLIGTPGRIRDAIEQKYLVLDQCSWLVLDEADKMIDLGFEEDVNFILDSIKSQLKSEDENQAEVQEQIAKTGQQVYRVTHLFSATMPPEVEIMAKKYLRAFCYISIGEPGGGKKDIDQIVEFVNESEKRPKLKNILIKNNTPPIIIFVNQKSNVDSLAKAVESWGWNSVVYHGSRSQQQREAAVDGFKAKRYDILIATDLAGRGLHVEGVKLVINYDAPKNIRDFVHRTGRTGRAGKKGIAYTFITSHDEGLFYDLRDFLLKNDQPVPEALEENPASKIKPGTIETIPRRKQVLYAQ